MTNIKLRSKIYEIIEVYGGAIGSVPLQLLWYHVNNPQENVGDTDYSREEIMDELHVLEEYGMIEKEYSWRIIK